MSGVLVNPSTEVKVGGTAIAVENIMDIGLHLGCTKEVSSYEVVVNNSNVDYYPGEYSPGAAKEFTKGDAVTFKIKRGTITSNTNYLLTGILESLEFIDQAEEYQFRDIVILRGRCKGYQLYARKYDGDLNADVGILYKSYKRATGEAESLIAYLIDNYTSLDHFIEYDFLSSTAAASQKVVNVVDGSKFTAGELVKIYDSANWEYNKIESIATNALTMVNVLLVEYATGRYAKVYRDSIRDSNTTYSQMIFSHETLFDIIKFISDTASTSGGVIGYDARVEYDGEFAWLPRGHVTESYTLAGQVQLERYLDDASRIKNKITVLGKADKAYPYVDGQEYSDIWTEHAVPSILSPPWINVASAQDKIVVSKQDPWQLTYAVDDTIWIIDNLSIGEFRTITATALSYGYVQSLLTGDAAAAQKDIDVTDGTKFEVGDTIKIHDDASEEFDTVASIAGNKLTCTNVLNNAYTVAANAYVDKQIRLITVDSNFSDGYLVTEEATFWIVSDGGVQKGWGWSTDANGYYIRAEATKVDTGAYSVEVEKIASLASVYVLLVLNTKVNLDDYPKIQGKIYFETTAPSFYFIRLRSGTCGATERATSQPQRSTEIDKWLYFELLAGSDNAAQWTVGSAFDWTDIRIIDIYVKWAAAGTEKFYIDRLHLGGKRWGGGSDNSAVDGYAYDATSVATYGVREHVVVSDMLLSDKECEAKAQSLKAFYKNPRVTMELESNSLDWGDYPFIPGNKVAVDMTPIGIADDFRIDCIDIYCRAMDSTFTIVFTLDNTPPRRADYLYNLSKRIRQLEKNYKGIR